MRSTTQLLCLSAALATTALAQDAYAPAPAANASMTTGTGVMPATTTVDIEPCDEETPVGTAGTGGMPPATSGTWVMPTAPTASSQPSDAPPEYTGAAAAVMQPMVGGLLMAAAGLLPALV